MKNALVLSVRVLLVDSKASIRRGWARALIEAGIDALTSESLELAPGLVPGRAPVVLVVETDALQDGGHGTATLDLLARSTIVATADPAVASRVAAELRGSVFGVLERMDTAPAGLAVLIDSARRAADSTKTQAAPTVDAPELVLSSRGIRVAASQILDAADSSSPLLVVGEDGTGKRALARLCHAKSHRAMRPFVALHLAEVGAADLEQAFADASASAGAGTLVLERVDALDREGQRVLSELLDVEVRSARLISTARPTIRARDSEGFDRDLYLRLGRHVADVPALRDRPDDIPVLAYTCARRVTDELGLPPKRFSVEAVRALRNAPWPGNVPELFARVQGAVVSTERDTLVLGDFGFVRSRRPEAAPDATYVEARNRSLAEFERAYVDSVLSHVGGNVTRAAQVAGMDRANFRRLVKRTRGRPSGGEL